METTAPGMLMEVRLAQFLNAPSLMLVTLLPNVTSLRLLQPLNVLLSTVATSTLTLVRLVHL